MERLRVLIADDHTLFRYGMQGLLSTQPDIEVVGEATAGKKPSRWPASYSPTWCSWISRCQA
ncbi:MAG: hypothetical protein WKF53_10810 [Rubrobacter sp.]